MGKYIEILAEFLRSQYNDEQGLNDEEMIANYGGNISCAIIADFGNGKYLCKSKDSRAGTVYTVIDSNNFKNSFSGGVLDGSID